MTSFYLFLLFLFLFYYSIRNLGAFVIINANILPSIKRGKDLVVRHRHGCPSVAYLGGDYRYIYLSTLHSSLK